jgi:hypothetical protein
MLLAAAYICTVDAALVLLLLCYGFADVVALMLLHCC